MSTVSVPAWFGSISMHLSMLRRMEKLLWRDDASYVQLVHWGSAPSLALHLSAMLTEEYKRVFESPSSSLKQALLTTMVCKCFTEHATTITKMIAELGIRGVRSLSIVSGSGATHSLQDICLVTIRIFVSLKWVFVSALIDTDIHVCTPLAIVIDLISPLFLAILRVWWGTLLWWYLRWLRVWMSLWFIWNLVDSTVYKW